MQTENASISRKHRITAPSCVKNRPLNLPAYIFEAVPTPFIGGVVSKSDKT